MQQIVFLKSGKLLGTALIISTLGGVFRRFFDLYERIYGTLLNKKNNVFHTSSLRGAFFFHKKQESLRDFPFSIFDFWRRSPRFRSFFGRKFFPRNTFPRRRVCRSRLYRNKRQRFNDRGEHYNRIAYLSESFFPHISEKP